MRRLFLVLAVLLLTAASGTLSAQQPAGSEAALTNANVVKLMKLRLGNDVVIAKVNQAAEVNFDLSPDSLAKLKSDGVSKEVIAAMLKRATPPSQQPQPASLPAPNAAPFGAPNAQSVTSEVRLHSKDGEIVLVGRRGDFSQVYAFVTVLLFYDYPGATSKTLISDRRPAILARLQDDPKSSLTYLVKLDPDKGKDKRSLKIGKGGMFNAGGYSLPDPDWTVPFDAEQVSPGLWRIVPKADLNPGEYGFFVSSKETLYDFAVN